MLWWHRLSPERGAPTRRANDGPGLATSTTKGPGADDRSRNSTNLHSARLGVAHTQGDEAMSMLHEYLDRAPAGWLDYALELITDYFGDGLGGFDDSTSRSWPLSRL
jgi:hypothetical protein